MNQLQAEVQDMIAAAVSKERERGQAAIRIVAERAVQTVIEACADLLISMHRSYSAKHIMQDIDIAPIIAAAMQAADGTKAGKS